MSHLPQSAWASFFSREKKRLIAYVRGLIDDAADREGEDIVQDVALGLFDRVDFAAPVENLSAYVYQALRNRAIDYIRRKRGHDSLEAELPGETGLTLADILADLNYDAAGELERKEISRDLGKAIDALDEPSQAVFIATEIEGRSFKDLSDDWDIPIGTLLARKSRAMAKLRTTLLEIDNSFYSRFIKKG